MGPIERCCVIAAAIILMSGCDEATVQHAFGTKAWYGAAPVTEAELDLCEMKKRRPASVIIRHHGPSGRLLYGDVLDYKGFDAKGTTELRSAIAVPVEPVYRQKIRADCRDPATGRYYPCYQTIEFDMREVAGLARSNIADPTDIAMSLCSEAARRFWQASAGFKETNKSQECKIAARAICPLPATPKDKD